MTNTQRMTTAEGGAPHSKNGVSTGIGDIPGPSEPRPLLHSTLLPTCQDHETISRRDRIQCKKKARAKQHGRITFNEILARVRPANLCRIKNRAFAANEVAKTTRGPRFRKVCYRIKDGAINALLRHRGATLDTLELSLQEPLIGLAFDGGGKLHTKPSSLDCEAREVLKRQFLIVVEGGIGSPSQSSLVEETARRDVEWRGVAS